MNMISVGRSLSRGTWLDCGQFSGGDPALPGVFEYASSRNDPATIVASHAIPVVKARKRRFPDGTDILNYS